MNVSISIARMRGRLVAPVLLSLLVWTVVSAQSTTSELLNPSSISFAHDGRDVTGFVAYVTAEGAPPRRIDLGAIRPDDKGRVAGRIPVLPPGIYTIEVAAYNRAGESPRVRAVPTRFRITERKAESTDLTRSAPRQTDTTPDSSAKDEARTKEPGKSKRGFLGKIYGTVVGSEGEDGK